MLRSVTQYLLEFDFGPSREQMYKSLPVNRNQHKPITNYLDKVDQTIAHVHGRAPSRIYGASEIVKNVRENGPTAIKYARENGPAVVKYAWENSTPEQKVNAVGQTIGRIAKSVATRLIAGPIGSVATTMAGWQLGKQPQSEI